MIKLFALVAIVSGCAFLKTVEESAKEVEGELAMYVKEEIRDKVYSLQEPVLKKLEALKDNIDERMRLEHEIENHTARSAGHGHCTVAVPNVECE